MSGTTIVIGDWNSADPAAPEGRKNIEFAVNRSGAIPKISGSIESPIFSAKFIVGIGAPMVTGTNVAPIYRVKQAGTIYRLLAIAGTTLLDPISFMIKRHRSNNDSPETFEDSDILLSGLTIPAENKEWHEITSFAETDLELGDELRLDILSGSPMSTTLELFWR